MIQNEKNRALKQKPLLLFSPLDWGLGHTTRSIPLLRAFQDSGWQIVVACDSTQKNLLEKEIYGLRFISLAGYAVTYAANGRLIRLKIVLQLRNILTQIKREHQWLQEFLAQNRVDAVLSDNRYGLFSPSIPCIFITHQLKPLTGWAPILDRLFQKALYRMINRFTLCWVPDDEKSPSLAGELAHPEKMPAIPVEYIGNLSRLTPITAQRFEFKALVMISGPEPQRSIFERIVMNEIKHLENNPDSKFVVLLGNPLSTGNSFIKKNVHCYSHLDSQELSGFLSRSEYVICRSGYTSLMDMIKVKKKMILVPTPGQPEQEYLALHFARNNYAVAFSQKTFSLTKALEVAQTFPYAIPDIEMLKYKYAVSAFTSRLVFNHADR